MHSSPAISQLYQSFIVRLKLTMRKYLALVAFVTALLVAGLNLSNPAWAQDYPSWADVQAAKNNEAAKQAQIAKIEGLISALNLELAAASAESDARGAEYGDAQEKLERAELEANTLAQQSADAKARAQAASTQAGRLAAQLYRSGGSDLSMNLMLEGTGNGADQLLSKLGNMSKMVERSSAIYAEAQTAQNEADALGKQAEVARVAREALKVEAEKKFAAAQAAQAAVAGRLAAGQAQQEQMQAQLAALKDNTAATVAGYENGLAAARAAAQAEAAARGVAISSAGWTHPIPNAYVSDSWGPRVNFYIPGAGWTGSWHNATDLAAPCGTPIYAASGGTVTYAGAAGGGYGYMVEISHGNGIRTRYGHVQSNGFAVWSGQSVGPGQLIARVGSTGSSTGCHTHFEVHTGGGTTGVDPQVFLRQRGVEL